MPDRYFLMSLSREWLIKVTDSTLNEDGVYKAAVGEFLNSDLSSNIDVKQLTRREVISDYGYPTDQFWDLEV